MLVSYDRGRFERLSCSESLQKDAPAPERAGANPANREEGDAVELIGCISGSGLGGPALALGVAEVAPVDVGVQLLAADCACSRALDLRAVLGRDSAGLDPLLDRLKAADLQNRSRLYDAAEDLDRTKDVGVGVHTMHPIQDYLVLQEIPVLTQEKMAHNLRCMETIHARIKRLRQARGLSMKALAAAIGIKSWQTVQQWESDDPDVQTAPRRSHQTRVAEALGVSVEELMHGVTADPAAQKAAQIQHDVHALKLDALRQAVRAMARDFGVSPEDLVSETAHAQNRVAAAMGREEWRTPEFQVISNDDTEPIKHAATEVVITSESKPRHAKRRPQKGRRVTR